MLAILPPREVTGRHGDSPLAEPAATQTNAVSCWTPEEAPSSFALWRTGALVAVLLAGACTAEVAEPACDAAVDACADAHASVDSATDAAPDADGDAGLDASTGPLAGDRLGLFGPAPSLYEFLLANEDEAARDVFHFGRRRTGFTWPLPVVGDFDGDGYDSVGFYDHRAGVFHLRDEASGDARVVDLGLPGGIPIVGDWDGDGTDTLGVYDPTTGAGTLAAGDSTTTLAGPAGHWPLAADLDGDGADEVVYYAAGTFTVPSRRGRTVALGPASGYPFAADLDGDGVDGVGVFDLEEQTFYVFPELAEGTAPTVVRMSEVNWVRYPIVGRWRSATPRPTSPGYPYESVAPEAVGVDGAGLGAAAAALDGLSNLRSFLVLKAGALTHESYFHGNRADIAHNIKSASKSMLGAVLLLAVEDGTVPDQPISMLLPPGPDDGDPRRATITLDHLLTMTSGLEWDEAGIGDWFVTEDWAPRAFSAAMSSAPGTTFNYSTGNTHLASAIVTRAAGVGADEVARDRLFAPLGIVAERWDVDPEGVPVGGAEVTMRPRDMARFGQLFLEDGRPDGVRIVSTDTIAALRTGRVPASAIDGELGYGGWWWTRTFGGAAAYFAWGYGGQLIVVFPTLASVVVVTARSDVDGPTSNRVSYDIFAVIDDYVVPALGG